MKKYDTLLTSLFMLLALAAVVLYFAIPDDKTWFFVAGGVAIAIRLAQYIYKLLHPEKKKRRRRDRIDDDDFYAK